MTGLTCELIDDRCKGNTRKWLEEVISRQFGICAALRDYSVLTKEQIIKKLKEDIEYVPDEPILISKEVAYDQYLKSKEYLGHKIEENTEYVNTLTNSLVEIVKLKQYADEHNQQLLSDILNWSIEHLNKDIEYTRGLIQFEVEDMSKEFHYDEEEVKKQYEKDLKEYKEKISRPKVDGSEPYRKYLSQLEEAYNNIEVDK